MIPIGKKLLTVLDRLETKTIAVLGDIILDQYTWGSVKRISPEAPIPILQAHSVEYKNGGAACASSNIAALDCNVDLYGCVGNDANGRRLTENLRKFGINTRHVIQRDDYTTIVKNRILTHRQQIIRVDFEDNTPMCPTDDGALKKTFSSNLPSYDAVLISDYGKGFLTRGIVDHVIESCRKRNIPVIVDPDRHKQPAHYKNATVIKPNRHEAEACTGIKINVVADAVNAAARIVSDSKSDYIALSLDKDGVLLYHKTGKHTLYAQSEHEVFDVTGAGDMFVSVLAVLLANKNLPESSVSLANIAAGISVTHMGVVTLDKRSIRRNIEKNLRETKILHPDGIVNVRKQYANPLPLILVNGIFDNLSTDQILFLNALSKIPGDIVVAINSDESVLRLTGHYPRMNTDLRLKLLSGFDFISWLTVLEETDASALIYCLKPDIVAKDSSRKKAHIPVSERNAIREINARIEFVERPTQ